MTHEQINGKTSWRKGYVQVYTGNGKGKTTAAFGLALRAAGAGLKVFIAQFAKGGEYSEIHAFERFSDLITVRQYGRGALSMESLLKKISERQSRDSMRSGRFSSPGNTKS